MIEPHVVIEGVVSAIYAAKPELERLIRTAVYTPVDEMTGVPHGLTIIQSFYIKEDDELGQKYYDDKGVQHNVHALGLSFRHDKYDALTEDECIGAVKEEIYEYFSALETYPFMKKIEAKYHEARNSPRGFLPDNDQNTIGKKKR